MNVGSGAGHGRWRSEQMSQLLERLLPGFLQILAMLLLVGGLSAQVGFVVWFTNGAVVREVVNVEAGHMFVAWIVMMLVIVAIMNYVQHT